MQTVQPHPYGAIQGHSRANLGTQSRAVHSILHSTILPVSSIILSKFFLLAIDESTLRGILPLDFLLGSQRETTPAPPVGSADRSVLHMGFIFIFCFFRHSRFRLTIIVIKGGISRYLTVYGVVYTYGRQYFVFHDYDSRRGQTNQFPTAPTRG